MGIVKRGDKYRVNVAYKGSREFGTAETEQEAQALLDQLKAKMVLAHKAKTEAPAPVAQLPATPTDLTWALSEGVRQAHETAWKGTPSEAFYAHECKKLVTHFGADHKLSQITTTAVDAYKKVLRERGNAQGTINHSLATLSKIFKVALERGGAEKKPTLGMQKVDRSRVRYLTEHEELAMLGLFKQWGKQDVHDWVVVLLDTGFRPSESRRIDVKWVDFRTNQIHIWKSKTKAGIRAVPMTTRVKAILEKRCLLLKEGLLFPYTHDVLSNAWDRARDALKALAGDPFGLGTDEDFVPYACRHTFATRLVQRGEQIAVIQKLLGHETQAMTMIYAHFAAEQYVSAIAKLEKAQQQ